MSAILMLLLGAGIVATGPHVKTPSIRAAEPQALQSTKPPTSPSGNVVIGSLRMVSATVGWGFGNDGSRSLILRTTDGGMTWADVSPKVELRDPFTVLNAMDADHVWLGVPTLIGGHRAMTVYRSTDAGKRWAAGESIVLPDSFPNARPLPPSLQFVDSLHGWLTFAFQANDPTSAGVGVYATTDGGAHWRLVSLSLDSGGTPTVLGLPIGCDKTGMVFNDAETGWATAHCADGSMFFYASTDGGRSWLPRSLPVPSGYPTDWFANCNCGTLPPIFSGSKAGVLMFHSPDLLYVTRNGGMTWEPLSLPTKYVLQSEFSDAQHGWINGATADPVTHSIRPDRLYLTSDGGKTWDAVTPDHELAGALQFVEGGVGWLTERPSDGPPTLYKSVDGGKHWTLIEPRLISLAQESA